MSSLTALAVTLLATAGTAGAAPGWQPAERLSPEGLDIVGPRVAVDADGDAVAMWGIGVLSFAILGLQASERPAGGAWSAPATLDAAPVPGFSGWDLAVTPGGTAVAAWGRTVAAPDAEPRIRSAVRPPGGAWSAPEDGPVGYVEHLTLTPDGAALAMWDRMTAFRPAGGGWGPPEAIPGDHGASQVTASDLAMDRRGNAAAVWSSQTCQAAPGPGLGFDICTPVGIQAATRPVGGSWTQAQLLPGTDARRTVHLPSGTALTLFEGFGGVAAWQSPPGGAWSAAETAPEGVALGDFGVDATGNLLAVRSRTHFPSVDPETGQAARVVRIEVAARAPDGTWSAPEVVADVPGIDPIEIRIAVGPLGGAIIAWTHRDDFTSKRIMAVARPQGGTWGAPTTLSAAGRDVSHPQVAVDADGDGVVIWQQDDGTDPSVFVDPRVYGAVFEIDAPLPPGPAASAPRCGTPPAAPAGAEETEGGPRFALTAGQLRTNQRIGQAAIRRLNAVNAWLDAGIEGRDLCGGAIGTRELASGIATTRAPGPLVEASLPDPRPVTVAEAPAEGGEVRLAAAQLLINQRIYQAAIRRASALETRLAGNLTGGDLKDGTLSQDKLARRLVVLAAGAGPASAPSRTAIAPAQRGEADEVALNAAQLRINQRIAQAAVRRANALVARLEAGLTGDAFGAGSITAADLAADLPNLDTLTGVAGPG